MVGKTVNQLVCCIVILVRYKSVAKIVQDSDRFRVIRHSSIFVDKTLLLRQLVNHDFVHIAAPRKFGKTTNLSMAKLFFGNDKTKRFVADYFRGTKIWEDRQFIMKHMCSYPVVHFTLGFNDDVRNHRDIVRELKLSIQNSFLEHKYVLNSSLISNDSKTQFELYCNMEEKNFETGLNFLSRVLYTHFKKRVTLLIDNFDLYLEKTIFEEELNTRVVSDLFYRILDNTVNLNDFVERSTILTSGSYKLGSQFFGTDRLRTFKFMESEEFIPFFGFTRGETDGLLKRYNLSDKSSNVSEWYGGYRSMHEDCEVLNPWSVLSYVKHKTFKVFWITQPTRKKLYRYLRPHYLMRDNIIPKLLEYEILTIKRTETVTQYEIEMLKEFNTDSNTVPDEITAYYLLLQFFLECGYLTLAKNNDKTPVQTKVKLPNKELKRVFELILEDLRAMYYD